MFGIGVMEMIILAFIGLLVIGGGVVALIVISLSLGKNNQQKRD